MKKLLLLLTYLLLISGVVIAEETSKKGITDYYPATADCSANAGPDIEVCYTESSFTLLGEIGIGNISSTPNYTWTGPAGFNFSPNNNVLKPTITRAGGFVPGTSEIFELCMDCNNGTSCNTVTVTFGSAPVQPTSLNAVSTGCNEVTATALPAPGPGDVGLWTWTPNVPGLVRTPQVGATNIARFFRNNLACTPYNMTYTVLNGGCESNAIQTIVNPEDLQPVSAGSDKVFCSIVPVQEQICGSLLGCNGATGVWSQVSGPPVTFTPPNSRCPTVTFPAPPAGSTQSYTLEYTVTTLPGSVCQGGTDQVTFTVIGNTGFELGDDETFFFCGNFPSTFDVCANAGGPAYNWRVSGTGGATISPIPAQPHCQTVNLPQGPMAASRITVIVEDPGTNGQCGDFKRFSFFRLEDVSVTASTVGIGCYQTPTVLVDLRSYLVGYLTSQSIDVTINSVPPTSNIPAPVQTIPIVALDVDGCYDFTIVVSNTDALTGLTCSETVDLVVCRYPTVEQPNAGASQSICAASTVLNGSTPIQAGTQVQWSQLSTNPPGAVINNPNQTDPMITGLNTNTNGATYGFEYTFTLNNPNGSCQLSDIVYITIDCEEDPCSTPTNVKCTQDKNGKVTYDWDPVPGVLFYEIAIDINSFFCQCPEPDPTYPGPTIQVPGNSWTPNASWQCASFAIRARCKEGWSSFTSPICMDDCVAFDDSVVYEDPFFGLPGGKRNGSHFDNELRIYPSPASNLVTIEGLREFEGAHLQLLDIAGRVVRSMKIGASDTYSLDVSQLEDGLYFIRVEGGSDAVFTQKVVIQH